MKVSICMPVWDRVEKLKRCYESLCNTVENFELIVVDNNSFPDVKNYVQNTVSKDVRVRTIVNFENKGHHYALFQAIKQIQTPYLFIIESDAFFKTKGWDQKMLEFSEKCPDIGIVAPFKQWYKDVGKLNTTQWGIESDYIELFCCYIHKRARGKAEKFYRINKSILLQSVEVVKKEVSKNKEKLEMLESLKNYIINPETCIDPNTLMGCTEFCNFFRRYLKLKIAIISDVDVFHDTTQISGPNEKIRAELVRKSFLYLEVRSSVLSTFDKLKG